MKTCWLIRSTYSFIHSPEEVDLILESIDFSLQFHLVHVGSIDILENKCTVFFFNYVCLKYKYRAILLITHLLQNHKVILSSCTIVDFILIPIGRQGYTVHERVAISLDIIEQFGLQMLFASFL